MDVEARCRQLLSHSGSFFDDVYSRPWVLNKGGLERMRPGNRWLQSGVARGIEEIEQFTRAWAFLTHF